MAVLGQRGLTLPPELRASHDHARGHVLDVCEYLGVATFDSMQTVTRGDDEDDDERIRG